MIFHNNVLQMAYNKNPLRFKYKIPTTATFHEAVWISKPHENIESLKVYDVL